VSRVEEAMTKKLRTTAPAEKIVATVRDRYGSIAEGPTACCGSAGGGCCPSVAGLSVGLGYNPVDLDLLPKGADLGLGCGAPLEHLALRPGETVVDLGSGAGIDALLAAKAVAPSGRVIGVDMTPQMVARARANATTAGLTNVEFREGRLEALPVADATIDAVTSNCVINLVPDKAAVFAEIARVLKPGGRLSVSDVLLDGELPEAIATDVLAWVGCVAGAVDREVYFAMLRAAGLDEIEIVRDADFLATVGESIPEEISDAMGELGISATDLAGVVRSVTYRARKSSRST
jgi:ubiquinone/menaquinone biosynthesis C-methylase UbiE